MCHPEEAHYFETLLCTLIAQAERPIRLAIRDIAHCGNRYRLGVQADGDSATVTLTLLDPQRPPRLTVCRFPRG